LSTSIPGKHFLSNLVHRRDLLFQLVRRDFEKRFVGSAIGWLWGVIHPLVLLLSWTFVFKVCLKMSVPEGEVPQSYTLWLFCGYLPWMLFQETVSRSSTSLIENSNLITKTVFPAEIIPVSIFLSSLINHLIAIALLLVAAFVLVGHISPMALLIPVYILLIALFSVGIGWIMAALQVYLRDTAQVLLVVLTLWFWITPIFIVESQVPTGLRFIVHSNPLAYMVRAYRNGFFSHQTPDLAELGILVAYSVVVFVAGGLFFRHLKRGFADVL
jgi:ABC-type polysaccharide/polyol phosphate export permease